MVFYINLTGDCWVNIFRENKQELLKEMEKVSKRQIGLLGASAIVTGNMMGSGIALLPSSFASIGSITLISWLVTLAGALSLAFVFSRLGLIDPEEGGLVTYAKKLSPVLGFQTGWLYWFANLIGNLTLAIAGVQYMSVFFPALTHPLLNGAITLAIIWIFTFINFLGADKIVKIVSVTVVLMLITVVSTGIFGWSKFSTEQFAANWIVADISPVKAVFNGIVLAIWSFVGIESASVGAGVVKKPHVTVPVATMLGTCVAGVVYIASTTVISGMFPAEQIAASGAPFAVALSAIAGNWVKPFVSLFTVVACLASLGSWMMVLGQASLAAAHHGSFPAIFAKVSEKRKVPVGALTTNSILMTISMILVTIVSYVNKHSAISAFSFIIAISVLLIIFPYFYSVLQLIKVEGIKSTNFLRLIVSLMAIIFCFVAFIGGSNIELRGALILSLLFLIFYALKESKQHGQS